MDSVSPLATDSDSTADLSAVTIVVCASCRDEHGSDAHPRAGALLAAETLKAAPEALRVRQVDCLGNCKRRLSAAILRDGCWSYVFGDLPSTSAPDLIAGAKLFAGSADGTMAALDAATGKTLWQFASAGSVMSGPSVVDGWVYWGSGYAHLGLKGAKTLYAFGLAQQAKP